MYVHSMQGYGNQMIDRFQYDNWPRWVKVAYCCTFPISCPVLMLSMMLGTILAGPVVLVYLAVTSKEKAGG